MRSFEERIAEIDRRSKQIIHMRKQRRKHMLMACMPLVLCLVVVSAFVLPWMQNTRKSSMTNGATEAQPGDPMQDRQESFSCYVAQIDISGPDFSISYGDEAKVEAISNWLDGCTVKYSENHSISDTNTRGEIFDETDIAEDGTYAAADDGTYAAAGSTDDTELTIIVTQNGGEKTEYHFSENTLRNLKTNQIYILSEEQVADLMGILYG